MRKNNKKEITLDELARLMQEGLLDLKSEISTTREDLKSEITETKNELKADIQELKTELHKKADKIDQNTLSYRVEKLEEKFA